MSKLVAFVSSALAFLLAVGIICYFRYYAPAGGFLHRDLDSAAVVKEVRSLNELVTVRYLVQKVVGLTEQHDPLGQESILLMVQGKVLAGVDLRDVNQYDVQSLGNHAVRLKLPAPHVLDAFIDEKNTRVWDRRITWWTPWVAPDQDLEHKARLQAIDDIRKGAIEGGILDEARHNAQSAIRVLLENFGLTNIGFEEAKAVS